MINMDLQGIKIKVRENLIIRIMKYPFAILKNKRKLAKFVCSDDSKRLKSFEKKYAGKRCFIIGNGPSLTVEDLNRLKNEYTFAANRIYKLYDSTDWRPTFWMCVDPYIIRDDHGLIDSLPGTRFVSTEAAKYNLQADENLYMIYNEQPFYLRKYNTNNKVGFSKDCSKKICAGETVTYNAIQMALYMGFTQIYLLGVDHKYSHVINDKGKVVIDKSVKDYFGNVKTENYNIQNSIISTKAYYVAREICERNNVEIKNATRGGALEVFERVAFDSLFDEK